MFIKLTIYYSYECETENIYVNDNNICSFFRVKSHNRTYINYSASNEVGQLCCDAVKETPEQIMELINNG